MEKLILASASPRRKEALRKLGIPFESVSSNLDEGRDTETLKMAPHNLALYLAKKKATLVSEQFPNNFVLAMDTIVVTDERIIGKPKDSDDAIAMLKLLNGKRHKVVTGITLINVKMDYDESKSVETQVTFLKHSENFLRQYVAKGESLDKAGAYGIQSEGKTLVKKINGDYSNVVGFPEKTVLEMLKNAGLLIPTQKTNTESNELK